MSTLTDYSAIFNLWSLKHINGCADQEINDALSFFDCLPNALVDYYRQLGGACELNHAQNDLLAPAELEILGDYLCFYQENQCVAQWCVALSDLSEINPPVYVTYNEVDFFIECDSTVEFFTAMSAFHALFSFSFRSGKDIEISALQAEDIKDRFDALPHTKTHCLGVSFLSSRPDCVIALAKKSTDTLNEAYLIYYAAQSEPHFQEIERWFAQYIFPMLPT